MGRGVSAGGGQSSLGCLFGTGEAPASQPPPSKDPTTEPPSKTSVVASPPVDNNNKQTPAGTSYATNNYYRADGQNCGNFITDRPSTKVHAAPGGGSSLNFLFGDGSKNDGSQ